jgi:hypothetical protein
VSTIAYGKYFELFSDTPIQPLQQFKLDIEGAGGQLLPYSGYIEVEVTVPQLSIKPVNCIMLVVPDTNYAQTVPVILGTNILDLIMHSVQDKCGTRFSRQQNYLIPGSSLFDA